MHINQVFELSMTLDSEQFQQIFNRVLCDLEDGDGEEYVNRSLSHKGITVIYRKSQYKKKIRLIVNSALLLSGEEFDPNRAVHNLNKRVSRYFEGHYSLDDFMLSRITLTADLPVGKQADVSAYLRILRKIGKVKNFSPADYEGFSEWNSFCLEGNSNDTAFLLYDLHSVLSECIETSDKQAVAHTKGILRAEVRLSAKKAIRKYIKETDTAHQILSLHDRSQKIFIETFVKIIPFGDFYKKEDAVALVQSRVSDLRMRRRMLRLIDLIPEKKSLLLAQKAMQYRQMDKVIDTFAEIGLSPVTIGKRHNFEYLKTIYTFLLDNC